MIQVLEGVTKAQFYIKTFLNESYCTHSQSPGFVGGPLFGILF
jgi:hypothetical protein